MRAVYLGKTKTFQLAFMSPITFGSLCEVIYAHYKYYLNDNSKQSYYVSDFLYIIVFIFKTWPVCFITLMA